LFLASYQPHSENIPDPSQLHTAFHLSSEMPSSSFFVTTLQRKEKKILKGKEAGNKGTLHTF